jgi:hypothetical protein
MERVKTSIIQGSLNAAETAFNPSTYVLSPRQPKFPAFGFPETLLWSRCAWSVPSSSKVYMGVEITIDVLTSALKI